MMKKLQRLKSRSQAAGLDVSDIMLNIQGEAVPGLRIDTDYEGPYPPKETFQKLEAVRKIAKGHNIEKRGYYVSVFVW